MKLALGFCLLGDVPGEAFGNHAKIVAEAATDPRVEELRIVSSFNVSPYDRARGVVAERAVAADADLLLFIDADTLVPSGGVERLLDAWEATKAPVVSGRYFRRGDPYTCVWSIRREDGTWGQCVAGSGVHEIHVCGLGCTLLDLRWFTENVPQPWWHYVTGCTEDVFMCEKVRAAGGRVMGVADVSCGHLLGRPTVDDSNAQELQEDAARAFAEEALRCG